MARCRAMRLAPIALAAVLGGSSLASCAADPVLPAEAPPAAPPPAPPPVPRSPCDALDKPLRDLRELASLVGLGRSMAIRPQDPERFTAELREDAKVAGTVTSDDREVTELAAEVAARLQKIAEVARTSDERARAVLLDEMERGELPVQLGARKCPGAKGPAGRMSAAAIQRVVRPAYGNFKQCYEAALRRDPTLRGAVRVRFTVARDGAVSEAADADGGGPDPLAFGLGPSAPRLEDPLARACVGAAYNRLVFPRPQPASVGRQAGEARPTEAGTFSGTYPIELFAK